MFHQINPNSFLEAHYSDGCEIPYRFYPSQKNNNSPLIVVFHGAGEVGTDNLKPLLANDAAWVAVQWEGQAHVLVCQYPTVYSQTFSVDERNFMDIFIDTQVSLIQSLKKNYSISNESIFAIALSMGAGITVQFMRRYPGFFKKVVLIAMRKTTNSSHEVLALNQTSIWLIHGEHDPVNPCENSKELYSQCIQNGHSSIQLTCYTLQEMLNFGLQPYEFHTSWSIAFKNPQFMNWFNKKVLSE